MKPNLRSQLRNALFLCCFIFNISNYLLAQEWSEPYLISEHDTAFIYSYEKDIVAVDSMIWVAWKSIEGIGKDLSYHIRTRTFDGVIWSETNTVFSSTEDIYSIEFVVDNQKRVWAIYRCDENIYSIYENNSTWSEPKIINNDTAWARNPSITVTENNDIFVSYMFGQPPYGSAGFEVAVAKWDESSKTWMHEAIVSDNISPLAMLPYNTSICSNGSGGIWVAWNDAPTLYFMYIKGSYFNGTDWEAPVIISSEVGTGDVASQCKLASDGLGQTWITYLYDNYEYNIMLNRANNGTWSANSTNVSLSSMTDNERPDLAIDNSGKVWIAWEYCDEHDNILSRTFDNGALSDTMGVCKGFNWSGAPELCIDGNNNIFLLAAGMKDSISGVYLFEFITDEGINLMESEKPIKTYPNPFKSYINIEYENSNGNNYILKIYNQSGKLVKKSILNKNTFTWDGKDIQGNTVKSGVYFIKIINGRQSFLKSIIKL